MSDWNEAQAWETSWWGDCTNTLGEELKQLTYARRMGLEMYHDGRSPYNIDLDGMSVLDIGGGPVSMLLKCTNRGKCAVADPMPLPTWAAERYKLAKIVHMRLPGEKLLPEVFVNNFEEVWIYNCLQHTQDPQLIIENAKQAGGLIRIFEWIDTAVNVGHPHSFTVDVLDEWLGGHGRVEQLKGENSCYGKCYYGVFQTKR